MSTILTYGGASFDFARPDVCEIDIHTHALATTKKCYYGERK